ncbi:mucin-5AC-like isoform X4 [Mizuhopecten yessoensis]|uniref:mucin-5AC-like isoform X4 n=1 Tax=Mizuhopecten yessoensis TaxID=6573 RepID=UPI000B45BC23|nr:mucin-5AC-like isoform X4 [Mizuhopecten yessoensis]
MAKGGGEKAYFVGTIKKTNEPSRSLARETTKASITYVTEQTIKAGEREEEGSPSGGSKKVRFIETQNNKEQASKYPDSTSTTLQTETTSGAKGSNSRTGPRNTANETPQKSLRTDSRFSKNGSPTKSIGTPSRASLASSRLSSNGTANASGGVPQSPGSQQTETGSQFKFNASADVTPDLHSLISPPGKTTGNSLPSAASSSKRSDDFRFHAGYEDDFEKEDENPKGAKGGKFAATPTEQITSGSAKSSVKHRIDSTPSLPPAKQNGLVTSNDADHNSKPQSPEKSKRSTADVKTQSIPNIGQKNTDDTLATRQPPTSPSKSKREDHLPSSPSKTKRDEKPPPSPSKVKRDGIPPSSPSKETHASVEQSKSGKPTSSKSNAATVISQSNKENTKPPQESTQPTLVKENVQKHNGKFVATYTRTRTEKTTDNRKTENNKERMAFSPQSRTTEDTATDSNATKDSAYQWHAPARKYEIPRNNRPVKPKAVTINSDTESSRTNGSSGKPPVFKLKLHKKPMYSRDKKAKEKEVVLTPRTQKSSVDSSRPKSFHLERDKSIYRTNTHLWEEERGQLTYQPSTNTQTDVMMAYTGEPNTREALKSACKQGKPKEFTKAFTVFAVRSKQPPWHESEYVLNRREAKIYQGIKQVYDKPTGKKARQRDFMKKLEQFQVAMAKHQLSEMQQKETKKYTDKARQANQLKELRQRFEDEAWHRFHTQYVTSRVLEHEKMNRFQYGLPEEPDGEPEFAVKLKRKKKNPQSVLNGKQLSRTNQKRYSDMFDVNTGPNWNTNDKEPKMEGIDTVVLDVKDEEEDKQRKHKGEEKIRKGRNPGGPEGASDGAWQR